MAQVRYCLAQVGKKMRGLHRESVFCAFCWRRPPLKKQTCSILVWTCTKNKGACAILVGTCTQNTGTCTGYCGTCAKQSQACAKTGLADAIYAMRRQKKCSNRAAPALTTRRADYGQPPGSIQGPRGCRCPRGGV